MKLHRFETSQGYILRRNQAAELASAPILISIDDDAAFSTPHTVEQTLADFDHPRIGAVAIPFINVNQDKTIRQAAPGTTGTHLAAAYIGTAHALRRDLFLRLGGYRGCMVHQGEEIDYCIRMLDAGSVVRLGRADPIHHFESPRRDFRAWTSTAAAMTFSLPSGMCRSPACRCTCWPQPSTACDLESNAAGDCATPRASSMVTFPLSNSAASADR